MRPRKQVIDPKKFKKHSTIIRKQAPQLAAIGKKISTPIGYVIPGTVCKDFETYYEYIGQSMETDTLLHDKKTRVYRVVNGSGVAVLSKDDKVKKITLVPGDELNIQPGITYKLEVPKECGILGVIVIQSANYTKDLQVIKESSTATELPEEELEAVDRKAIINAIPKRRGSKAAQQQRQLAKDKGRSVEAGSAEGAYKQDTVNKKPATFTDLDLE